MRFWKKKYKVKRNVPKQMPKKTPRADLRRYSSLFFLIGLNITVWAAFYALDFKTFFYPDATNGGLNSANVVQQDADNAETGEDDFKVLQIDAEELDNLVNTIAYTHAVWPGYKGDLNDGVAVRKHFSNNLAKYIINNGRTGELYESYKIHFYYVVRDDGNIQYLAIRQGGKTSKEFPKYLVKSVQKLMNIGVPGIIAGTDEKGEPITVVYELVITFTPAE